MSGDMFIPAHEDTLAFVCDTTKTAPEDWEACEEHEFMREYINRHNNGFRVRVSRTLKDGVFGLELRQW